MGPALHPAALAYVSSGIGLVWVHEGSAQRKPQGPARWGRVVGMHEAAPAALWTAWGECTCAGAALLATFSL